jgi:hypothetical protein
MPSFDRDRFRVVKPDSSRALPISAGHRWIFAHHPLSWEVADIDGTARWVPKLRRIPVVPGANGVRKGGDDREMLYALQRNGWTVIENGGAAGVYADECIARNGTVWLDRWCTPHEFAPGRVKIRRTDEQREEYQRWCADLVDAGALPEPDPVLLEEVCERYEDTHIRRHLSREMEPSIARKLERARATLAKMREASLRAPELAEKPKRRRARAAKGEA